MNVRNMVAVTMVMGSVMGAGVADAAQAALAAGGAAPNLQVLIDLNLTPAQKKEIKSILKAYRPVLRQAVDGSLAARKDLFDAIHADVFNEAAVRQSSQLAAAREVDLSVLRARLVADLKVVLTTGQKAMLDQHREAARGRFDKGVELARTVADRWLDEIPAN